MTDTFNHRRHPLILIVDDGMTIRLLVREALEQAGFLVEEAEDGRQALKMFQQLPPDLVLLDVMMPELDGFQTCAARDLRIFASCVASGIACARAVATIKRSAGSP